MKITKSIFYAVLVFMASTSLLFAQLTKAELQTSFKEYPVKTELTKQALQLHRGMTKAQVLQLLGQPTWARHYKGEALDWTWVNGPCEPVDVTFDEHLRVSGFDEGRAECLDHTYTDLPNNQYLCSREENKKLCS